MFADRSLVIAVLALTAYGVLQPAAAQTVAKPAVEANAAADTKAAEAAKAFAAGTKAFESGRTDAAVAALSTAIMSGGLKNPELAKAFFYRGVAQRTQKKPGAALSDLNAAVWLRDGLSATDKAVAEDHRQALFREIAERSGAPTSVAAAPAANPVPAVTPAPAAAVEPASPPAVAEQTPSTPTWPWSAAAPAPPAAVPAAEPAKEAPPIPRAQEFVNTTPPAVEKPLPWTTATDAAKPQPVPEPPSAATAAAVSTAAAPMLLDTIVEPVASVAAVERGNIAPVHAEPAPPEKPLPWASASVAPANSEPQPWATDAKPVQTSSAAPAVAVPPQPVAPEAAAPRTAEPVASMPVSMPAADPVPITESVGNAASAASDTLAGAGEAATQFIGSLFGGSSSAPSEAAEANTAPPQSAPQADAVNGDSGAQTMPRAWPTETNAATQAARVETAAISKPVEVAVREEAPAWSSQTRATPAAASNPPPLATAQPMSAPPDSGKATASTASAANVAAANSAPEAGVPPSAVLPGPYRLQIAAENTREDAEQTLARLVAKHRPSLKGLEPVIEEPQTGNVLFGSMGAAYRVSLGPYVTSVEPGRLCNILQPHGFDCRVVAVTP